MVREIRIESREQRLVAEGLVSAAESTMLVVAKFKILHVRVLARTFVFFAALEFRWKRVPASACTREILAPVILARKTGKTRGSDLGDRLWLAQRARLSAESRRAPNVIDPHALPNACVKSALLSANAIRLGSRQSASG